VTIVSWILIAVAAVWFLYKLYLSYTSSGGTDLMLPVYDAAMYPPAMAAFGLYWVQGAFGRDWPWWVFLIIWLVLTGLAAGAIRLAEELGDKAL
jgi:hypothetical protein